MKITNKLIFSFFLAYFGLAGNSYALNNGPYWRFHEGKIYYSCDMTLDYFPTDAIHVEGSVNLVNCGGGHYVTSNSAATQAASCNEPTNATLASLNNRHGLPTSFGIRLRLKQATSGDLDICFLQTELSEQYSSHYYVSAFSKTGEKFNRVGSNVVPNLTRCAMRFLAGTVIGTPGSTFALTDGLTTELLADEGANSADESALFCRFVAEIPKPTLVNGNIAASN